MATPTAVSCRSLTGAWIETLRAFATSERRESRSLTGAWIETSCKALDQRSRLWSLPHGSVD